MTFATNAELMAHLRREAQREAWALRAKANGYRLRLRHVPFQPIDAHCEGASDREVAERIGLNTRHHIYALRRDGITLEQADEFATALNVHPEELWPGYCELPEWEYGPARRPGRKRERREDGAA